MNKTEELTTDLEEPILNAPDMFKLMFGLEENTRRPPRESVYQAMLALLELGVKKEQLAYSRRYDVVFVNWLESSQSTRHGEKTQWPKV